MIDVDPRGRRAGRKAVEEIQLPLVVTERLLFGSCHGPAAVKIFLIGSFRFFTLRWFEKVETWIHRKNETVRDFLLKSLFLFNFRMVQI